METNLADFPLTKPVKAAWRMEATPAWGEDDRLIVVEYIDGTGQAFDEDSREPLYVEGVSFEDEPSGHLYVGQFGTVTQLTLA
jgi:hypothetical protein